MIPFSCFWGSDYRQKSQIPHCNRCFLSCPSLPSSVHQKFSRTALPEGFGFGIIMEGISREGEKKKARERDQSVPSLLHCCLTSAVTLHQCSCHRGPPPPQTSPWTLINISSSGPFVLRVLLASHSSCCLGALSPSLFPLPASHHCKLCLNPCSAFPSPDWTQDLARTLGDTPICMGTTLPVKPRGWATPVPLIIMI